MGLYSRSGATIYFKIVCHLKYRIQRIIEFRGLVIVVFVVFGMVFAIFVRLCSVYFGPGNIGIDYLTQSFLFLMVFWFGVSILLYDGTYEGGLMDIGK